MVAINRVESLGAARTRIAGATVIANHPGMAEKDYFSRRQLFRLLDAAAKLKMFCWSAGTPNATDALPGMFCLDTTNDLIYVCTDRSAGTWTKLAE